MTMPTNALYERRNAAAFQSHARPGQQTPSLPQRGRGAAEGRRVGARRALTQTATRISPNERKIARQIPSAVSLRADARAEIAIRFVRRHGDDDEFFAAAAGESALERQVRRSLPGKSESTGNVLPGTSSRSRQCVPSASKHHDRERSAG